MDQIQPENNFDTQRESGRSTDEDFKENVKQH